MGRKSARNGRRIESIHFATGAIRHHLHITRLQVTPRQLKKVSVLLPLHKAADLVKVRRHSQCRTIHCQSRISEHTAQMNWLKRKSMTCCALVLVRNQDE